MPIYYDIQRRANPNDPEAPHKYFLIQKSLGTLDLDFFIEDIVKNKSLTKEEARTGIVYFFDAVRKYLKLGYNVNVKGIGRFYVGIKSEGSNAKEEANYHKKKALKLHFVPSKTLTKEIEQIPVKKYPFSAGMSVERTWKVKDAIQKAKTIEIIEKSLLEGLDPDLIAKITNVSREEILLIQAGMESKEV